MDKDAYRKVVAGVFFEMDLLEVIISITLLFYGLGRMWEDK
jgi:hypothetical protein